MKELRGRVAGFQLLARWTSTPAGEIYAARDERSGADPARLYALTFLSDRFALDASALRTALRMPVGFGHPELATPHDVFEHEGTVCVVSDFVAGETLGQVLRAEVKRLPQSVVVAIVAALARALEAAHAITDGAGRAMVHGDLCPANVMLTYDGRVVLIHFGLALAESRLDPTVDGLRGHFGYMAPERASCAGLDGAADVYALGLTLYEMLAAGPAYRGLSDRELVGQAIMAAVPPLPTFSSRTRSSEALRALLARMLEPDPSDRPTAREVSRALEAIARPSAREKLANLMARRFEHKARAWRTLEAQWIAPTQRPPAPRPRAVTPMARPAPAAPPIERVPAPRPPEPERALPSSPLAIEPLYEPTADLATSGETRDLPLPRQVSAPVLVLRGMILCALVVLALSLGALLLPADVWQAATELVE